MGKLNLNRMRIPGSLGGVFLAVAVAVVALRFFIGVGWGASTQLTKQVSKHTNELWVAHCLAKANYRQVQASNNETIGKQQMNNRL